VVLGMMVLACAAVFFGTKRLRHVPEPFCVVLPTRWSRKVTSFLLLTALWIGRCGSSSGKGSRRYGHYRMVGLSGSAPPPDEL
jgi:hypothetical protein